ncbi:MAG: hypothetical protein BGO49_07885 [Planctomycetales bacterium 71-10]|nr:MAG: hypothetical protein BGO49_07885 [Planctomycetales bacterium 71-10]
MGSSERRFHLSDVVVLVVAAALMLSADRAVQWIWVAFSGWFADVPSWDVWQTRRMAWSLGLAGSSLPLLALLLMRRSDRARLRDGAPGLFAHAAVASVVAMRLAGWVAEATLCKLFEDRPRFYQPRWTVEVMDYLGDDQARDVAVGVTSGWLALMLVGRWNPERAWDDRLGRLLGLVWLGLYLGSRLFGLLP